MQIDLLFYVGWGQLDGKWAAWLLVVSGFYFVFWWWRVVRGHPDCIPGFPSRIRIMRRVYIGLVVVTVLVDPSVDRGGGGGERFIVTMLCMVGSFHGPEAGRQGVVRTDRSVWFF